MTAAVPRKTHLLHLPGMDGTGLLSAPLAAALPAHVRARIVTYPADRVLTLAEYARHAADHLPDAPVVLVAESFSGLVALELLAHGDARIRGVIFCAAFGEPPLPLISALAPLLGWGARLSRFAPSLLLRAACVGMDAPDSLVALLRRALAAVPPRVLAHRLALIAAADGAPGRAAALPCLYLQATHDRLVPARSSLWFAAHFRNLRLVRVDGPHFLPQARPAECAAMVTEAAEGMLARPD